MVRNRILRGFFVMMIMLGTAIGIAGGVVSAHSDLESSTPAADSTVDQAPQTVEVIFSSEVTDASGLDVLGPDGTSVSAGDSALDLNDPNRQRVTVDLVAGLPAGVYTVNWTAMSIDGHEETGSFTFTVAVGASASPVASPDASPAAVALTEDEVKAEMHEIADQAQQQATVEADNTDGLDEGEFFFGIGVGAAAALLIYLFWRKVRPTPAERVN